MITETVSSLEIWLSTDMMEYNQVAPFAFEGASALERRGSIVVPLMPMNPSDLALFLREITLLWCCTFQDFGQGCRNFFQ